MRTQEEPFAWSVIEDWPDTPRPRLHPYTPPTSPVSRAEHIATQVNIYALCTPGTTIVRYIGKTRQRTGQTTKRSLDLRRNAHIYTCRLKKDTYLIRWLRQLMAQGQKPDIMLLDVGDEETWPALEMFHISAHQQAGFPLTNVTDGGEGCNGFKHSPEHLAYMSRTLTGRKRTPEQRARMSEAYKKCPIRRKKGKMPPDYISPMRGRPLSTEHKRKLSLAKTGKIDTQKREDVTCANCGTTFTAKTCAKRKYCSLACSTEARTSPNGRGQPKHRTCALCGMPFTAQSHVSKQRYCSKKCAGIAKNKQVARTCKTCGINYSTPPSIHPTFCSETCRRTQGHTAR